ncbi:MAG: acyltransferase [Coprothermobacterota bacterium]|nr:acyltransferase [Coprothermobacterota bacterium]
MEKPISYIHPTAEVSPKAQIGAGARIWNQVQVREGVVLGENCILSKDVYIDSGVHIGAGVKIQNGVSVYHGVTVEDDAFLGPHMVFTNDLYPRSFIGDFEVFETLVKRGASIGAGAVIICGTTLGEYCMIGSGAVVTKDVPPYALVVGNPGKVIGGVCRCGRPLRLADRLENVFARFRCSHCNETLKLPVEVAKEIRK